MLLFIPLIPAFAQQPCNAVTYANGTTVQYSGANCAVTIVTPPTTTPTTSSSSIITNIAGSLPTGILSQIESFISNIVSNSGLTPNNNPAHLDSTKLGTVSNSWLDTLNKIVGVATSLHSSATTTITNTSPVPIDPNIMFIISAILIIFVVALIVWKLFKGILKFFGVILVIIIILMEYKIQFP